MMPVLRPHSFLPPAIAFPEIVLERFSPEHPRWLFPESEGPTEPFVSIAHSQNMEDYE